MTLRKAHGTGAAALVRVETSPPDELPEPVPAPPEPPRDRLGRFVDGHASAYGARGGRARARVARLADSLGIGELAETSAFATYKRDAEQFVEHHVRDLAQMAGGYVGTGPSSMVASAGLALGASRFLYAEAARTGDAETFARAARLADQSRQQLLTAYELATREAKVRRDDDGPPDLAKIFGAGGRK